MRMGDFEPSPIGERLLPVILGVSPAVKALCELVINAREEIEQKGGTPPVGEYPDAVRQTTEYADAVSIQDEVESLALELRDEHGNVVATDWISFQDGHRLAALAREEMAAIDPDLEFDDDLEPWEPEPPRYQVLVALEGFEKRMDRRASRRK
jgi:hypothetical protein